MVSKAKLFTQCDDLEALLEERITAHLREAIEQKNEFIFCASDFISQRHLKEKTNKTTEELIILGRQILALKEKLGESSEGSIAERICEYCYVWSHPKKSVSRASSSTSLGVVLAQQFLDEIERHASKNTLH